MTYEADLFATLAPLVAGRVYPETFPEPDALRAPTWPAIRYTFIDSVPVQDICGDGDEATDAHRVQLDIVSAYLPGYDAHRTLRAAVRAAMQGFPVPARIELSNSGPFDPETQTYRSTIDYSLHGSS